MSTSYISNWRIIVIRFVLSRVFGFGAYQLMFSIMITLAKSDHWLARKPRHVVFQPKPNSLSFLHDTLFRVVRPLCSSVFAPYCIPSWAGLSMAFWVSTGDQRLWRLLSGLHSVTFRDQTRPRVAETEWATGDVGAESNLRHSSPESPNLGLESRWRPGRRILSARPETKRGTSANPHSPQS